MNLIEQLERLDLKGRQAKVYLALLQLGSASAIEIAKYTKLKHPTVYDVLDLLREKQLVCETLSGRRRLFSPEDPGRLSGRSTAAAGNGRASTITRAPRAGRRSVPRCSTSGRGSISISARCRRC